MGFLKKGERENDADDEESLNCADLQHDLIADENSVRRRAARDITQCPGATNLLLDQLAVEEVASVRQIILSSLTVIGDQDAVNGLVECLRSEDAALRNEAIEAMKLLPQEVALIMRNLLTDSDPDVRIFAVNILESLCHPSVEEWLVEVISIDEHINVCATAVDLLGEVGSQKALDSLSQLKDRFPDEPYIQFAADLAIKRINGD